MPATSSQPYAWFLERNSSETSKNVLTEVDGLVVRVITPLLRLTSNIILVLATIGFLMVVDPQVTLLSSVLLGGSYALIYLRMRGKLHESGKDIMTTLEMRYRIAQEATGGIKDVKLLNLEPVYSAQFAKATQRSAQAATRVGVVCRTSTLLPRSDHLRRIAGPCSPVAVPQRWQHRRDRSDAGHLCLFRHALAARLAADLPWPCGDPRGRTRFCIPLQPTTTPPATPVAHRQCLRPRPCVLTIDWIISKVSFKYASAERQALNGLDLTIPARTTIGIVGGTGAGKTTLIDLILGLLTPHSGEICVDGTRVTPDNLKAWQNTLGYVPQSIFLTDDTIAANIAFGVPKESIDRTAIERAARAAALHDFVTNELSQGYDTLVGERGVRLSGGQRQRIGIARALYRSTSLLIMDEATSALDNITERVVMEAVQNIRADTTIILIAHRLSTVRDCDRSS